MVQLPGASPQTPDQVVGAAIQNLAAARLGRGFMPLACAFVLGVAQVFTHGPTSSEALALSLGAPLTGGAMLAHGLRIVQSAFRRPHRPWMTLAAVGSLLPPAFGLYLLGWRGLRELASTASPGSVLLGALFTALGLWALATWMQLNELIRLTQVMLGGGGGGRR